MKFLTLLVSATAVSALALTRRGAVYGCPPKVSTILMDIKGLSGAAAQAARRNPGLVLKYFKSNNAATIDRLTRNYEAIFDACDGAVVKCVPSCDPGIAAYAGAPGISGNVNSFAICPGPLYLPPVAGCGANSLGTLGLHEMTHEVLGTADFAYGNDVLKLNAAQAMHNADTYAEFIKGKWLVRRELERGAPSDVVLTDIVVAATC